MASINASTSGAGGVITTADATGNLNIQSGGTTVVALTSAGAAVTGTLSASGVITATGGIVQGANAAPAFSAYSNTSQSLTSATFTKVTFQTEYFDTNNNFASSTFTPTVAGYYQVNAEGWAEASGGNVTRGITTLYKNGTAFQRLSDISPSSVNTLGAGSSIIVYMNGSSDYLEIYYYITVSAGTGRVGSTTADQTNQFSAALIRSA